MTIIPKKMKVKGITIQLEKAAEIKVSLSGAAISARTIVLCDENGKTILLSFMDMQKILFNREGRTDQQGKLVLKNLKEGVYRIKVLPRDKNGTETLSEPFRVLMGD